ncbi:MAG TPA: pilus assembly protein PilP [Gammaproteobacteria bacterium]|nr:pilus assembly protein PilP [Gammaproteobacteria bacterium]
MIKQCVSRRKLASLPLLLLAAAGLTGCANDNVDDLVSYVAEIRETRKGVVKPLPPQVREEGFRYQASRLRDPFMTPNGLQAMADKRKNSSIHPDMNREREPLEAYQLDTLRMVGSIQKGNTLLALIQAPDGVIHQVRENNYLGRNHGRVKALSRDGIELVETIPDGMGGWMERPAQLSLKD